LLHLHTAEIGYQWIVRALQQHSLLATPVATTDVQTRLDPLDACHNAVDEVYGKGQFLLGTAFL
jgi:hypothetical protein